MTTFEIAQSSSRASLDIASPAKRAANLRTQIKQWERSFAALNNGRKPSKDDIRQDAAMAAQYREYNYLRSKLSQKSSCDPQAHHAKRKRSGDGPPRTPSRRGHRDDAHFGSNSGRLKRQTTFSSISDAATRSCDQEYPTRSASLTPRGPSHVDPTPQKDGRVLGLFDILEDIDGEEQEEAKQAETPSGRRKGSRRASAVNFSRPVLNTTSMNTQVATPNKIRKSCHNPSHESDAAHDESAAQSKDRVTCNEDLRSPMKSKTSPLKRKIDSVIDGPGNGVLTPASASRYSDFDFGFDTPLFLRREAARKQPKLMTISEVEGELMGEETEDLDLSAAADAPPNTPSQRCSLQRTVSLPVPAKGRVAPSTTAGLSYRRPGFLTGRGFGRTLSTLMAEARQRIQAAEDERLDADLETIEYMQPGSKQEGGKGTMDGQKIQLDPNEAVASDEQHGTSSVDAYPLRKKKGAKRQTRRANLKPIATTNRRVSWHGKENSNIRSEQEQTSTIDERATNPESKAVQISSASTARSKLSCPPHEEQNFENSRVKPSSKRQREGQEEVGEEHVQDSGNDGRVAKAVKKVNALAHANFRRLNIRNASNSSGGKKNWYRRRRQ